MDQALSCGPSASKESTVNSLLLNGELKESLELQLRIACPPDHRASVQPERMMFEQIPTYGPIHMAGHEGFGDFVFVPTGKHP